MKNNSYNKLYNPIYHSKITMSRQQLKVYSLESGDNKSYTLDVKSLNAAFESIINKLISLNDTHPTASKAGLDNLEEHVNNLESKDFICLVMSLFYFRDGNCLPQAYTLFMRSNQPYHLDYLKKLCDLCGVRFAKYKLHKTNTIYKDVHNLDQILKSSINACLYFIDKTNLGNNPDLTQLKVMLDNMVNEVQCLIGGNSIYNNSLESRPHKIIPPIDNKHSLTANSTAPLAYAYNTISDFGPSATDISNFHYGEAASINTGAESIVGVLWGLCQYSSSLSSNTPMGQLLGYYKSGILKLVEQICSLQPNALTKREIDEIKEILSIKSGSSFDRISSLVKGTRSSEEFEKIIKNSGEQINVADNHGSIISAQSIDVVGNVNQELVDKAHPILIGDLKFDIKYLLKQSLQSSYNPLLQYVSSRLTFNQEGDIDFESTNKIVIEFIQGWVFRYDGFSGTLWMHLQRLKDKDANNNQELLKLNEIVEQIFLSRNNQVQKMRSFSYGQYYLLLSQYQSKNRYTTILDIQNYLIAIQKSENLSPDQKKDLLSYFSGELISNADNKFSSIRVKRSIFASNTALAAFCYQGLNFKRDIEGGWELSKGFGRNFQLPSEVGMAASGGGWAVFSTLVPISKYFSIGNTRTYTSIKQCVTLTKNDISRENVQDNSQPVLVKQEVEVINNLIDRLADPSQDSNEIYCEIIRKLKTLQENELELAYCVLTSFVDSQPLIQKLFLINDDKFTGEINAIWKCVAIGCLSKYDEGYKQNDPSSFSGFKRYLASVSLDYKQNAILVFYRVMAIINAQDDDSIRIKMLDYFAKLINRAKLDTTSVWANLRKMDKNKALMIAGAVRIFGAILWGVGSSLLCATGVGAAVLIPVLMLLDGVRGVIYGISNYFEYENSKEYKAAIEFLARSCKTNCDDLANKLKSKNLEISSKYYSKVSCRVLDEFICKIAKSSSSTETSIKEKFSALHGEYEDDKQYIDELNTLLSKHKQDKTENNHQFLLNLFTNICLELSSEVADKFTATEVLFRMVRITMLSNLSANDKARILICFVYMARSRSLKIFEMLSTQRNFFTRRNYLIPDFIFGVTASSTTNAGVAGFSAVYQTLFGGVGDSLGWLTLSLGFNNSNYGKTKSFNASLEFLKKVLSSLRDEIDDGLAVKIDLINADKIDTFAFACSELLESAKFEENSHDLVLSGHESEQNLNNSSIDEDDSSICSSSPRRYGSFEVHDDEMVMIFDLSEHEKPHSWNEDYNSDLDESVDLYKSPNPEEIESSIFRKSLISGYYSATETLERSPIQVGSQIIISSR